MTSLNPCEVENCETLTRHRVCGDHDLRDIYKSSGGEKGFSLVSFLRNRGFSR